MDQVNVNVDGVNINATHYAKMTEKDAVTDMTVKGTKDNDGAMGLATAHGKDADWAKNAHGMAVKAVATAKAKDDKEKKKLTAETVTAMETEEKK